MRPSYSRDTYCTESDSSASNRHHAAGGAASHKARGTSILVDDFIQIAKWSCDDIVLSDYAGELSSSKPYSFAVLTLDIVIHDFSERVFLMHGSGKIEIAAIMARIRNNPLECSSTPSIGWCICAERGLRFENILLRHHGTPTGNDSAISARNLHRLHDGIVEGADVLVCSDENTDTLIGIFLPIAHCVQICKQFLGTVTDGQITVVFNVPVAGTSMASASLFHMLARFRESFCSLDVMAAHALSRVKRQISRAVITPPTFRTWLESPRPCPHQLYGY